MLNVTIRVCIRMCCLCELSCLLLHCVFPTCFSCFADWQIKLWCSMSRERFCLDTLETKPVQCTTFKTIINHAFARLVALYSKCYLETQRHHKCYPRNQTELTQCFYTAQVNIKSSTKIYCSIAVALHFNSVQVCPAPSQDLSMF